MMTSETAPLLVTAQKIAAALGQAWGAEPGQSPPVLVYLNGPEGATIRLALESRSKRMIISGKYPSDPDLPFYHSTQRDAPDAITVNAERTPQALAEEIRRRLLPGYLPELKKAQEELERARSWDREKHALTTSVCSLLGVDAPKHKTGMIYAGRLAFEISSPSEISIRKTIYLSIEQLKRIFEAVPELFKD